MSTTAPPQRLPIVVNIGAPGALLDRITVSRRLPTITAATFSMRPLTSRVPILDAVAAIVIAPPDINGNNVSYDWTSNPSEVVEGDFSAWWGFTTPDGTFETPEFPILISDHGPGTGTETGALVDGVQSHMPVTLNALRDDDRFGDRLLQQQAEVVKWRVLGYTVAPDSEFSLHVVLRDYLSKRLALELIRPGIDYWTRQIRTATSTQTAEVTSYPDIIKALQMLQTRFMSELPDDWRQLQVIVPGLAQRQVASYPVSSLDGTGNVTRDPQTNQRLLTGLYPFAGGFLFP